MRDSTFLCLLVRDSTFLCLHLPCVPNGLQHVHPSLRSAPNRRSACRVSSREGQKTCSHFSCRPCASASARSASPAASQAKNGVRCSTWWHTACALLPVNSNSRTPLADVATWRQLICFEPVEFLSRAEVAAAQILYFLIYQTSPHIYVSCISIFLSRMPYHTLKLV